MHAFIFPSYSIDSFLNHKNLLLLRFVAILIPALFWGNFAPWKWPSRKFCNFLQVWVQCIAKPSESLWLVSPSQLAVSTSLMHQFNPTVHCWNQSFHPIFSQPFPSYIFHPKNSISYPICTNTWAVALPWESLTVPGVAGLGWCFQLYTGHCWADRYIFVQLILQKKNFILMYSSLDLEALS